MKIQLRPIGKAVLWLLDKVFAGALLADELNDRRKQRARQAEDLTGALERRSAKTVIIPKRKP